MDKGLKSERNKKRKSWKNQGGGRERWKKGRIFCILISTVKSVLHGFPPLKSIRPWVLIIPV